MEHYRGFRELLILNGEKYFKNYFLNCLFLSHSPLHVRALADFREGRGEEPGEVIVKVRECRTSHVLSHILIGVSIVLIPMDKCQKVIISRMCSIYSNL